ncbi:MAG: transglycosylase domain-containing protein [Anaerolineales bacterium]|nr:transglycosylase domain-containing protein [Anaerolineales bacterium]
MVSHTQIRPMPTVTQVTRMRERRRSRQQRKPAGRLALGCAGLASLALLLGSILLPLAYSQATRNLPSIEVLPYLLEPPDGMLLQPTRLYDHSGEHVLLALENPATSGRTYLRLRASDASVDETDAGPCLPQELTTATLAALDPHFWEHAGFSLLGASQGGQATLAQRLAADLLLQGERPGLRRALRERLLAAQITNRFGREKVLEWYLNSANFGRLAYGADAAALLYFGKPATELDLAESAMLAAAAAEPGLNPLDAPQAALERQKRVIQAMLRYRMILPEQGVQAARQQLDFQNTGQSGQALALSDLEPKVAPAFARLALSQLRAYIPAGRLERGGLRIITSLDYDLQIQAACTVQFQLAQIQAEQGQEPLAPGPDCEAARLLLALAARPDTTPGGLQAEILALEPVNGHILALVGEPPAALDGAYLSPHPPGSMSAPFIYLTAFTRGASPASLVWDTPAEELPASIQNFDKQFHGPLRLRLAMANDYLVSSEKMLAQVGPENAWRTAQQLGIRFPQPADTTQITSASLLRDIDLVEISRVFGVFANQGVLAGQALEDQAAWQEAGYSPGSSILHPVAILRVEDLSGQAWLDWNSYQTRPIISAQLAYLVTSVLSDEIARWPSLGHPNPLEISRPAAARVGRTISGNSAWAIGYTPQLVVGAWVGAQGGQDPLPDEQANTLQLGAAGLWHAVMQFASRDLPYQTWEAPPGLSSIPVCDPSGMLPTQDCPNVVEEVFLPGNEPVQADRLYRSIQVNRTTGRLATVFTPPDLVEERVYFIAPAQEAEWAQLAGLQTPPQVYDAIPLELPGWPEASISSPSMFETVGGQVTILGKAAGEAFASYRIQVGEGLNPPTWFQVGEDRSQAQPNGQLGVWDTSGLNGLYAVQLLVVRQDQSAQRVTVLVTVDNQPPRVQIAYPSQGAELAPGTGALVLRAEVSDDLEIASVAFYLDGDLLTSLSQPPYAISWQPQLGVHSLRVQASDRAGNTSEAAVEFTIK